MHVVRTPGSARAIARTLPRPLGFVPTMGALHAGHLALVERALRECAAVAASIFVNPLQFAPGEDFERYPRAFEHDRELLAEHGVSLLYAPTVERMYGPGFATRIDVGPLGTRFEGAVRPGHFGGVATVVAKLLGALEPTALYLGQKDAQQTAVLRRMVSDLDFAADVVVAPTVREPDGLALSSRNAYLTPEQRAAAPSLREALLAIAQAVERGETGVDRALAVGRARLRSPLTWEYLALVDPQSFEPCTGPIVLPALALAVVRAGTTRLLDNATLPAPGEADPILTPPRSGASFVAR
jgi:pantoate--beta-alanine ligase